MKNSIEQDSKVKARWVEPTLVLRGNVSDLVRGGGKSGDTHDSDPQSTTKSGVG